MLSSAALSGTVCWWRGRVRVQLQRPWLFLRRAGKEDAAGVPGTAARGLPAGLALSRHHPFHRVREKPLCLGANNQQPAFAYRYSDL